MFPEPTELLMIGCVIESIWTPRYTSNTLTPETNSQTYWPREISHVMSGTIFCLFNISHFSSTDCSEVMSKRTQKDVSQERVTAKTVADDEFGLAMQWKESWHTCLYCIRKSWENQKWKSFSSEPASWAASKNGETRCIRILIKLLRIERW